MKTEIKNVTFQLSHLLGLSCQVAIHYHNLEKGVVSPQPDVGLHWLHWLSQKRSC